jgi:uncharacterized protein YdeI (BOF family)
MRSIKHPVFLLLLVSIFTFSSLSAGICGIFSKGTSRRKNVKIEEIYKDFSKYKGSIVSLEGTVVEQDTRGLNNYLVIQDGTGMMKVQLWVYNVLFREYAVGKKIQIIGKVSNDHEVYVINATKIIFANKTYRKSR